MKLAILSHTKQLQQEKIGKVANWAKLAIPSHSAPLQLEKIVLKMIKIDEVGCIDRTYSLQVEVRQVFNEFVSHSFNIQLL